ncbi:monovalent cation/H(+) antiporter subunit G [Pyrococcus abyssi]|uniref:Multisubunit Na+/H+ antiporter, putative n=1 Tax=Pyrococcus abyssi (strain GE5 / Orsay) TaxID=272844 RepID=Q9UZE4_PYRAB|nr:monovalent cation/H(+) antiporter subunit G [Pyrococcus abyssi]CAB50115.1 Multisubunit Na+/H+ antiporter, putative [Pyrococcus abyssi GE5]CCE70639.1 TPA: putative monovalent cation/H+ antiporter subunit G [Pyrococcus abyssi GE5]
MIELIPLLFGYSIMFFGALGVVRFPDVYTRLHAATKCDTGGIMGIVLGLSLIVNSWSVRVKLIFLLVLIAMINPMISHAIARGAYKMGVKPVGKVDMYAWDNA